MTRKMNYGIRISKKDFNVLNLDQKVQTTSQKREIAHLLSLPALTYLLGARTQVKRYQSVASTLKSNTVLGVMGCLHEVSNLFEDLNSVKKYLEKCGIHHPDNHVWANIRNHIRHAIREDFDKKTDRGETTAEELGLDERLQINIGFDLDAVKIGETVIELNRITKYLDWAENEINSILKKADKNKKLSKS